MEKAEGPRNWKHRSRGGSWVAALDSFEGETLVGPVHNAHLNMDDQDEVRYTRDGRRVALIREERVLVYDLMASAFEHSFECPRARDAAFSSGGEWLCVLTMTHLEVWSLEDGALRARLPDGSRDVLALGYARGDTRLVLHTSMEDGADARVYACIDGVPDLQAPVCEAALGIEGSLVEEIPGGPWVWLVGWDEMMVVSTETGEIRWRQETHHIPERLCVFGEEIGLFLGSDAEFEVSLQTGETSALGDGSRQNAHNAGLHMFSISTHGDPWNDDIRAFDAQRVDQGWDVMCLAFAPDERHVLYGGRSKELVWWDLLRHKQVRTYTINGDYASSLWMSEDGEHFSVSTGHRIEVRRVSDGRVAWYMATSTFYRGAPVLSPCKRWLVHSFVHTYNGFGGGFMVRQR